MSFFIPKKPASQGLTVSTFARVRKMGSGHLYFWLIIRPKWHCTQLTSAAKPILSASFPVAPYPTDVGRAPLIHLKNI